MLRVAYPSFLVHKNTFLSNVFQASELCAQLQMLPFLLDQLALTKYFCTLYHNKVAWLEEISNLLMRFFESLEPIWINLDIKSCLFSFASSSKWNPSCLTSSLHFWSQSSLKNIVFTVSLKFFCRSCKYRLSIKAKDAKCSFTFAKIMATWIHQAPQQSPTTISTSCTVCARFSKLW